MPFVDAFNSPKPFCTVWGSFKKDKEEICLEAIKFIVDFNIYKFSSNKNTNVLNMFFFKNKIIRTISDFENFNLSKKSLLDVFQEFPDHV